MLLRAKKLAFLGLLLAIAVLLVILSGIFEFNTLFLIAGASFCVGIAIRESGLRFGFGFYIASILLALMLAPNKLYCLTFSAMGLYIVITEFAWKCLAIRKKSGNWSMILWTIKYLTFNIMYIPILIFMPKLIYQGNISNVFIITFIVIGQIVIYVYDKAYNYFQISIWGKIRGKLQL